MRGRALLAVLFLLAAAAAAAVAASGRGGPEDAGDDEFGEAGTPFFSASDPAGRKQVKLPDWHPPKNESNPRPRCLFLSGIGLKPAPQNTGFKTDAAFMFGPVGKETRECSRAFSRPRSLSLALTRAARPRAVKTTGCEPVFFLTDTTTRGWDDEDLVREYCDAIEKVRPRVVFTHSMGNLVVAHGIHRKISGCKRIAEAKEKELAEGRVAWLSSQGPLRGSPSGDFCIGVCGDPEGMRARILNDTSSPVRAVLELIKLPRLLRALARPVCHCQRDEKGKSKPARCVESVQTVYVAKNTDGLQLSCPPGVYRTQTRVGGPRQVLRRTSEGVAAWGKDDKCVTVSSVHFRYARATMCGLAPTSISKSGIALLMPLASALINHFTAGWGIDATVQHKKHVYTGTDGFVPFESCRGDHPRDAFASRKPIAALYALKGSHADGCFRYGDATFDPELNQMPLTWLFHQIRLALRLST